MKAKPWQIVIIALAFVAVGASAAYMLSQSGPKIDTKLTLIDVTTGQLYEVNLKKHRVALPARDPEKGEYRLFPVRKNDDGKWVLTDNGRGMIRGTTLAAKAVNIETGEVLESSDSVQDYSPPVPK